MPGDLPQRVLLVLHEERLGGASRGALLALAPLVAEGRVDLQIWCARPSDLAAELEAAGHSVAGAPRPFRYSVARLREPPGLARRVAATPSYLGALVRHARALRPDVVHVNAAQSLPEAIALRAAGFPILFHVHEALWPGPKAVVLRNAAWAVAHEVAAVSEANARPLARGGRVPRVLPEPVRLVEAPVSRVHAPVRVAAVGALSERKGSDVFVAAAELVARGDVPVELHLVGGFEDAPGRAWADALVRRAEAAGVSFRERVDVRAELAGWDIVVMPSRDDPFPLVVLEAMAAARAVVGTRVGGIEEQLADGAGVLVPSDDPAALAEAIVALARDPVRRAQLGAAGYARVAEYSAERAAERLADAYEAVLRAATVAN